MAPIDGIVGNIQPQVGDYVEAGDRITSITQNDVLELNISVPLEQADQLELGLPVEIIDDQEDALASGEDKLHFSSNRPQQPSNLG